LEDIMKKLLMLTIVMLALGVAGSALAVIDWAGNVYPNNGAVVVPTGPVDVYAQVYKGGVTTNPGQGADISAVMFYTTDIAAQASVAMTYLGDNGASNDEYTAQVPQAALAGAAWVDVTITFTDATDASDYVVSNDQNGNPPPFRYNVTNVLPNDVDVSFRLCLSGDVTAGDVCVIGSAVAIGTWGTGVTMNSLGGDFYNVTVTFPAGSNPAFEYKYKKDGCATWEGVGNRMVVLPTDGSTTYGIPQVDSWNNTPLGCGLGNTLEGARVVCFQVCLSGVTTAGGVCVVGNVPALDSWGTGVAMTLVGVDLYQACITFPAGIAIPQNLEYKFKKDDCTTWEGTGNHLFSVDNTLAAETTLTHTWEDGVGACDPVGVESESWGGLKSLYR
jgi:hypothetical protein